MGKTKKVKIMNKKILLPLAMLLIAPVISAESKDSEVKTGYFNSAAIVSQSKVGKETFDAIEQKRTGFAAEFKILNESYENHVRNLQAKSSTLSVAARQKAEQEAMRMKRELEGKAREYEEELKLAMNQAQDKLFKELSDAVYECGRKEGNDIMVDVATGRVYLINPDKVASTTDIVKSMDKNYDVKVAKGPSKKTAAAA